MKRVTNKQISAAIYNAYGIAGVNVFVGGGCCHFYSDDNETGLRLASWPSTTVYVYRMNHLTLAQWLSNFEILFEEAEGFDAVEEARLTACGE